MVKFLEPGMTDGTLGEDLVALEVHPDGGFVGSYHSRHCEGAHEIGVLFRA
jgi:hypothetical protein